MLTAPYLWKPSPDVTSLRHGIITLPASVTIPQRPSAAHPIRRPSSDFTPQVYLFDCRREGIDREDDDPPHLSGEDDDPPTLPALALLPFPAKTTKMNLR
ncbi:unnamed protein product [Linum trigynum]|uniref:Uncharacterized protein n=1 Tax=Linum trigynum TaxID=586398 RepID=A0AAV2GR82_9ROSI